MADTSQERTEQATERRLEEAASRGQVPYSRELTAAILLLMVLGALRLQGGDLVRGLEHAFRSACSLEAWTAVSADGVRALLNQQGGEVFGVLLPLLLMVLAAVAASGYLQIGFGINFKRLEVQWSRLNPASGLGKFLSSRSLVTAGFALLKVTAVGMVVWTTLSEVTRRASGLAQADMPALIRLFLETTFAIGFKVGAFILLLAIADLLWQRWRHAKDMMMTRDEVKEERKSGEGDPRIKGRIRQVQREIARARMQRDVKKATVVVRNPTHYAVALRYLPGKDPAPRVVAKGRNLMALRIIELATAAGVPVRTDPPLARQLYLTVRVGRTIPEELFAAVAKVLAWVFRKRPKAALRTAAEARTTS